MSVDSVNSRTGTVALNSADLLGVGANRIIGRGNSIGPSQELSLGTGLAINGATLDSSVATLGSIGDVNLSALNSPLSQDGKKLYRDGSSNKWKGAWASPLDPVADIRDFMDITFPAGWSYWGGNTNPSAGSDVSLAINAAGNALRTRYGRGSIFFPPQWYHAKTSVDPYAVSGHRLVGCGSSASKFFYSNASSGYFLTFNGRKGSGASDGGWTGGGIEGLEINSIFKVTSTAQSAYRVTRRFNKMIFI